MKDILEAMATQIEAETAAASAPEQSAAEDTKQLIESAVSQVKSEMQKVMDDLKAKNEAMAEKLRMLESATPGESTGTNTPEGAKSEVKENG